MSISHGVAIAMVSLLAGAPVLAQPQPEFLPLGTPPGSDHSVALGVSADGAVVVGGCAHGAACDGAWRWTRGAGLTPLGTLPGETTSIAADVSADGSVVVGSSGGKVFRWTSGGGMVDLGLAIPGNLSATATSSDGNTIVGDYLDVASFTGGSWRWTASGGAVVLQSFPISGGGLGFFHDVSADGMTVVGSLGSFDDLAPFRWTPSGFAPLPELPPGPGGTGSGTDAFGISRDGLTIVGESHTSGFRWRSVGGIEPVGPPPAATYQIEARAVSADGEVVVGSSDEAGAGAFVWTQATGRTNIATALAGHGVATPGWVLLVARAISDDGSVIVGEGLNPDGYREAWLAVLPRPVPPPVGALGPLAPWALALLLLASARRLRGRLERGRAMDGPAQTRGSIRASPSPKASRAIQPTRRTARWKPGLQ